MATPNKRGTRLAGAAGRWPGGRIYLTADGTKLFEIRRMVDGRRYEVSTGCTTLRGAIKQLERFEADPDNYRPAGDPSTAPIYLDADPVDENMRPDPKGVPRLVREFLRYSRDEKGNSKEWIGKQKANLSKWMPKLHGVDLRRATLRDHLLPAMENVPDRRLWVVTIKALFRYLRKHRHLITSAQDPTVDLTLPQAQPEQFRRSKVVPREHVDLVIEHLAAPWRDALALQAGTGWHTTEIVRFAANGTVEPLPRHAVQEGVAGVVVCPLRKSGEPQLTRVSATALAAAIRLRKHGAISREWYDRAVRTACAAVKRPDGEVGIPVFTPGQMRHTVATWSVNQGADPAKVAAFLGHKSPRTTRRFYATLAVAAKVPTLL